MILKTLIAAFVGTVGYCLMFKVDFKKILPASFGGLLACGIFLYFDSIGVGLFLSNFIAAAITAMVAEFFARVLRAPAAIFLLPSTIPLVPGGRLYYTMIGFVLKDYPSAIENGKETLLIGLGIACGMIASSVICNIITKNIDKYYALKIKGEQK